MTSSAVNAAKRIVLSLGLTVAVLLVTGSDAAATIVDAFYFTGSGYIAAGQTETLTPAKGYTFSANENYQNGASLSIIQTNYTNWWYLDFAALGSQLLAKGFYGNATRYPFNLGYSGAPSTNGLGFDGDGRGDNMLSGEFYVFDIQYGVSGMITSFAADFIQYDENQKTWSDFGSIRYHSEFPLNTPATVPLTVIPEPSPGVLCGFGISLLSAVRIFRTCRRRTRS